MAGLLCATLLWIAPGFDVESDQMDPRRSDAAIAALKEQRSGESNILVFYVRFMADFARGNFGESRAFHRPVSELLGDRWSVTLAPAAAGLVGGWLAALILAAFTSWTGSPVVRIFTAATGGLLLSVPAGLLGFFCLVAGFPPAVAIGGVLFPRILSYAHREMEDRLRSSIVLAAHARGLSPIRILTWYVLPASAAPLLALAALSAPLALGAAVPVEALCDVPGLGQLAWKAALGRDLRLLVTLTLLLSAVVLAANWISDWAIGGVRGERS